MRAVVIDYEKRELRERDVPEPRLEHPRDVLFRVRQAGVCGTDRELAAFHFGFGPEGDSFLIPGHEAVGEVLESRSPDFAPEDVVVPIIRRACHPPCASCARGRRDLCLTGKCPERGIFGAHGYFTGLAVDEAGDLIRLNGDAAEFAVLIEPLSVVEKAVNLAISLHQGEPRRAVVFGAGSIGLLAAGVLVLRGFEVQVVSVEPPGSPRERLVRLAGAEYATTARLGADIAIEAAGSPSAVAPALQSLAPLGVLVLLGAHETAGTLPLLDAIVRNQIIAGSVNASPAAFRAAADDLPKLPRDLLSGMIQYREFSEYRASFLGSPSDAPKIVHIL